MEDSHGVNVGCASKKMRELSWKVLKVFLSLSSLRRSAQRRRRERVGYVVVVGFVDHPKKGDNSDT